MDRNLISSNVDLKAETQRFLKLRSEANLIVVVGYDEKLTLWFEKADGLPANVSATISANDFPNILQQWHGPRRLALVHVPSEIVLTTNISGALVNEIKRTARFAVTELKKAGFKEVLLETTRWGLIFEAKLGDDDQP